jgi:hypothetical protein
VLDITCKIIADIILQVISNTDPDRADIILQVISNTDPDRADIILQVISNTENYISCQDQY